MAMASLLTRANSDHELAAAVVEAAAAGMANRLTRLMERPFIHRGVEMVCYEDAFVSAADAEILGVLARGGAVARSGLTDMEVVCTVIRRRTDARGMPRAKAVSRLIALGFTVWKTTRYDRQSLPDDIIPAAAAVAADDPATVRVLFAARPREDCARMETVFPRCNTLSRRAGSAACAEAFAEHMHLGELRSAVRRPPMGGVADALGVAAAAALARRSQDPDDWTVPAVVAAACAKRAIAMQSEPVTAWPGAATVARLRAETEALRTEMWAHPTAATPELLAELNSGAMDCEAYRFVLSTAGRVRVQRLSAAVAEEIGRAEERLAMEPTVWGRISEGGGYAGAPVRPPPPPPYWETAPEKALQYATSYEAARRVVMSVMDGLVESKRASAAAFLHRLVWATGPAGRRLVASMLNPSRGRPAMWLVHFAAGVLGDHMYRVTLRTPAFPAPEAMPLVYSCSAPPPPGAVDYGAALLSAAADAQPATVQFLLAAGVPMAAAPGGAAGLLDAAIRGLGATQAERAATIGALLAGGAAPSAVALLAAARVSVGPALLAPLLAAGADPNVVAAPGAPSALQACRDAGAMEALVRAGADVHVALDAPLRWAEQARDERAAGVLYAAGARFPLLRSRKRARGTESTWAEYEGGQRTRTRAGAVAVPPSLRAGDWRVRSGLFPVSAGEPARQADLSCLRREHSDFAKRIMTAAA